MLLAHGAAPSSRVPPSSRSPWSLGEGAVAGEGASTRAPEAEAWRSGEHGETRGCAPGLHGVPGPLPGLRTGGWGAGVVRPPRGWPVGSSASRTAQKARRQGAAARKRAPPVGGAALSAGEEGAS